MEDIYTIKVKSRPNPSNLYPSERRYSASTVLGLGVVHLALGVTAFLLASLTLIAKNDQQLNTTTPAIHTIPVQLTIKDLQNPDVAQTLELFSRTNLYIKRSDNVTNFNITQNNTSSSVPKSSISTSFTLAPCIMSIGAFIAGCTAILAWRRWYIDQNITWFFVSSTLATIISFLCLIVIISGLKNIHFNDYYPTNPSQFTLHSENGIEILRSKSDNETDINNIKFYENKTEDLRIVLALNIAIAAVLELVWSYLSMRIAWKGMNNPYVDDMTNNYRHGGGKLSVNTVIKGNGKKKAVIPSRPDIIAHYPKKGKFAKYFPTGDVSDKSLPKAESHKEFQERVHKFLTSNSSEDNDEK